MNDMRVPLCLHSSNLFNPKFFALALTSHILDDLSTVRKPHATSLFEIQILLASKSQST